MTRSGHVYTPEKTVSFEKSVVLLSKKHAPKEPWDGPIKLTIDFIVQKPKTPKNKHFFVTRPDLDNFLKAVLDAWNGLFFVDDSQVVEITARKLYSVPNCKPSIKVLLEKL